MRGRIAMALIWMLCALAAIVGLLWMACAIVAGSPRAWQIAIAFDQVGNATAGGSPDETISARCWRFRDEQPYRTLRQMIDGAFALLGDLNHCERAYNVERVRLLLRAGVKNG